MATSASFLEIPDEKKLRLFSVGAVAVKSVCDLIEKLVGKSSGADRALLHASATIDAQLRVGHRAIRTC
jgi:hypothetical protein